MCEECAKTAAIAAMVRMAERLGVSQGVGVVLLKETVVEEGTTVPGPQVVFIGDPILTYHVGSDPENTVNLLSEGVRILAEMVETGQASKGGGAIRHFDGTTAYAVFVGATTDENESLANLAMDVFEAVIDLCEIQDYLEGVFEEVETDDADEVFDE